MPATLPPAPAYYPALNGLRAVAVGIVLVQHWLQPTFPLGELGPSLFFVLSGYLVSGICWKYDVLVGAPGPWWQRLGTFYWRRALRIVPLYYIALAGCALLPLATVRENPGWFLLPGANMLIYRSQGWGDGIGHFWTIAVEMQFYLLWPVVLGAIGRRLKPLLLLVLAAWLFRLLWPVWVRPHMVHLLLPANLDLFALGAVLRLAQSNAWLRQLVHGRNVLLAWMLWTGLRLLSDPSTWAVASQDICLAMADFLTLGWLLRGSPAVRRLGFLHPAMQWVGQRSYSIYLYHLPLLVFWQRLVYHVVPGAGERALLMGTLPVLLVLGPVVALLSAISWQWIEMPIDRFKDRFRYAAAPAKTAENTH